MTQSSVSAPLLEVLGELQALRLVVRGEVAAVDQLWRRRELLVDEAADGLPVLQDEWHLVRTHLEHGARAGTAGLGMPEPRIEEARVVHTELADQRIERHHLGRLVGRHLYGFLRGENVELVGIEDQPLLAAHIDRLPVVERRARTNRIDIDEAGVALTAVADEPVLVAREIDRQWNILHRPRFLVAGPKADLRQARALAYDDGESLRANLGEQRPLVPRRDGVEGGDAVGDDACENV